jgi:KDEL-tailed cysteine endopeptidase
MQGDDCGTEMGHAVVIVGYGTDNSTGMAYWTVRNSYGAWWGESGYFRVQQTEGKGVCGINQDVAYPITKNT